VVRLDSLGSARFDADIVSIFKASDFTNTNRNPTVAVTSSVPAKTIMSMSALRLKVAFDDPNGTASTNSITISIGDGTDADLFLTATEVAADSTEVWLRLAPVGATASGLDTNVTTQITALGTKYYATAGNVVYTFTGLGGVIPSQLDVGNLEIYWREVK